MSEREIVVDIEKIMEEIREEVRKNGPYEDIPSFDSVPCPSLGDQLLAKQNALVQQADIYLPPVYPVKGGNPALRLYKKVVSKAVRCSTFPLAVRQNEINENFYLGFSDLLKILNIQNQTIHDLADRVQELENRIADSLSAKKTQE